MSEHEKNSSQDWPDANEHAPLAAAHNQILGDNSEPVGDVASTRVPDLQSYQDSEDENAEPLDPNRFDERLKHLPTSPGVYIYKNRHNEIIYVGKAINLRNRVRSYFREKVDSPKTRRLVQNIADFEFILTDTELEALVLECNLIKKYRPKYNVRLRDDKQYPYIKVSTDEQWPRVYITRRFVKDDARYFGPYTDSRSVWLTLDLIKKLFPYRSCYKEITGTDPRPCLDYHIHRCLGPCIGAVSHEDYMAVIHQVVLFLEGKTDEVIDELQDKMEAAAENLEFERAAYLRDQMRAIERVTERQKVISTKGEDQDVVALARANGDAMVQVFFIRNGKLIGREHFLLEGTKDESQDKILSQFLTQFYESAAYVPPNILLPETVDEGVVIEEWLRNKRNGEKVVLNIPHSDDQQGLVDMVARNAGEMLEQMRAKWLADEAKTTTATSELAEYLSLDAPPERIECYDISNIQGTNSVGAMVVFVNGQPRNDLYRKFQIKTVKGPNDFASLQEVLRRRFKRLGESMKPSPAPTRTAGTALEAADQLIGDALEEFSSDQLVIPPVSNLMQQTEAQAAFEQELAEDSAGDTIKQAVDAAAAAQEKAGAVGAKASKKDATWEQVPDLVIIDGGKGQLSAALEIMRELGVETIRTVGLAKEREEIFVPDNPDPIMLPRTSQALYLVQRIRDEAHRFGLTYHRKLRSKTQVGSRLDDVPGIGPKKRQQLIRKFGSVAGIRQASVGEIASAPGMTLKLAEKVKEAVGGNDGDE